MANEELGALLARLSDPTDREILTLRWRGCSIDEISRQLGVSPRAVQLHMSRIRGVYCAMKGKT